MSRKSEVPRDPPVRLAITVSASYDYKTGRIISMGVETPNAQGWHPRATVEFTGKARTLFPATLPRRAKYAARAARREKVRQQAVTMESKK